MKRLLWIISVAVLLAVAICLSRFAPAWTGFDNKSLWDWMSLILIPMVIALGGAWFTSRQEKLARDIEDRHRDEERALQRDRLREDALQTYLDRMTELMLKDELRASKPGDEVQSVARARTLTVLSQLDGTRKGAVVRFLVEAGLIVKSKRVLRLQEADLREVELCGAKLIIRNSQGNEENVGREEKEGVSLRQADLRKANLREAKLTHSDLWGADLADADLRDAHLGKADLRSADLTRACLHGAHLGGANLKNSTLCNASLCGAKFGDADLLKADLAGADVSGADLSHVRNLTQEQLESTDGDERVRLRPEMILPESWLSKRVEGIAQVDTAHRADLVKSTVVSGRAS